MISTSTLNLQWSEILPQQGNHIGRRVDPDHPLDFFIGFDDQCCMQLLLLSDYFPDLPGSSQQVHVRANLRNDGQYAICFVLVNLALKDMFVSLCWDIMDSTAKITEMYAGILLAVKRFRMWQLLLAEDKTNKMSELIIRGLIGELWVLKNICIPDFGEDAAVSGWIGPIKADRDFEYENMWYEVKTASLSKETVSISSLDQLDIDRFGFLLICRLEKTAPSNDKSVTLKQLIRTIKTDLTNYPHALSTFEIKLIFSGYDENDERANESYFIHGCEKYRVESNFPRICRSQVPAAICQGEYSISIAALQNWRIE